ncbi:MAG: hypothetical protein HC846_00625 [Blastocatellia bacterium]|nr:hypothetical protein [Blastocatellia bacterium]
MSKLRREYGFDAKLGKLRRVRIALTHRKSSLTEELTNAITMSFWQEECKSATDGARSNAGSL